MQANGFDAVLSVGCDVHPVPADLAARLGDAPAYVDGQPLFGLWPAALAGELAQHLAEGGSRSVRGWIGRAGARAVALDMTLHNLNTPHDLAKFVAVGR